MSPISILLLGSFIVDSLMLMKKDVLIGLFGDSGCGVFVYSVLLIEVIVYLWIMRKDSDDGDVYQDRCRRLLDRYYEVIKDEE